MSISAVSQYHSTLAQYRPPTFEADAPLDAGAPKIVALSASELAALSSETRGATENAAASPGFGEMVQGFFKGVNSSVVKSQQNTRDLMVGKNHDTGAVVASVEEANLELSLAIALQKKGLQAYQTLSQMQF